MDRINQTRSRLTALVAALLCFGLVASSANACCGGCGDRGRARQAAMSSHDCCPEAAMPLALRSACGNCGSHSVAYIAASTRAESPVKASVDGFLATTSIRLAAPESASDQVRLRSTNAPPICRPDLLSTIVLTL